MLFTSLPLTLSQPTPSPPTPPLFMTVPQSLLRQTLVPCLNADAQAVHIPLTKILQLSRQEGVALTVVVISTHVHYHLITRIAHYNHLQPKPTPISLPPWSQTSPPPSLKKAMKFQVLLLIILCRLTCMVSRFLATTIPPSITCTITPHPPPPNSLSFPILRLLHQTMF
jgi:hypothetical protein